MGQAPVVVTGQYHDIALATGQYHIYCPGGTFDLCYMWDTKFIVIREFLLLKTFILCKMTKVFFYIKLVNMLLYNYYGEYMAHV